MLQDKARFGRLRIAGSLVFTAALVSAAAFGARTAAQRAGEESRRVLEQNLRRAAIQCYALEGFYPPGVQYLEESFGVVINHEKYAVHYEGFASNLMPEITVTEK